MNKDRQAYLQKNKRKYVTIEKIERGGCYDAIEARTSHFRQYKEWESQLVEQEATDFQRMFDKWVHTTIAKLPEKNEKISLRKQMDGSFICMH